MPSPATNAQLELVSVVTGGMNSGVAPRLVPPNQLAFAINVTCRGGLPRTRPVLRKVALVYADETTQTNAQEALFQCASFYQSVGSGENCIVASIGGRLFRYLVGSNNKVQDISITGDLNSGINPNCWMWQAEDFLIVQNGQSYPLFFDGAGVRRSRGPKGEELPVGCMGVYVQGRIWQATPNRQGFIGGDLVYSHGFSGEYASYNGRNAVLKTTENTFLSGGGVFGIPITAGKVTAMAGIAIADTSLGQGPLQVMTQQSVFSVQTPILREDWADTQFPLMTVGLPNYGAVGQRHVAAVNGDLWYRSLDGIRSYQVARRDFNTWVNTPLSEEMRIVIERDTDRWLERGSSILFDNRLLVTCSPYPVRDRGMAHRGLIALDFEGISSLTDRSTPAYEGIWTGLPILQVVKGLFNGVERLFVFALDCDDNIVLYEMMKDGAGWFDWDGEQTVGIESSIETRSYGWKDGGNVLKRLLASDLYLDRLAGNDEVEFDAKWRTDEDQEWQDWHEFDLCAQVKDCTTAGCPTFMDVREQYRTYLRLPDPPETCSEITKRYKRTGYEFQFRLWWKGFAQLNRWHFWTSTMSDSVVQVCPTSETCVLVKNCGLEWFDYSIEDCDPEEGPEPVGILWEDIPPIFIETETPGDIIREEGQPPFAPPPTMGACRIGTACIQSTEDECVAAGGIWEESVECEEDGADLPVWPPLDPYGCDGETITTPIDVIDPTTLIANAVGIAPGAMTPPEYLEAFGEPGALEAWAAAVWSDFIASGTAYSQARLEWYDVHTTGDNYNAAHVFPAQAGGYGVAINLDTKIIVRYCPA